MDYFDVADEIRITIPAPKVETNQPPPPRANPPPQTEREIWVRKISGRPWSAAAKEFVPQLKPIFAAQKIPPELVWVAEVESSFDWRARSPAGAAGLFPIDAGHGETVWTFLVAARSTFSDRTQRDGVGPIPETSLRPVPGLASDLGRLQRGGRRRAKAVGPLQTAKLRRDRRASPRRNTNVCAAGRGRCLAA